jgi:hypothetical protein
MTSPIHLAYHATQARTDDLARAAESSRRRPGADPSRAPVLRRGALTPLRPLARLLRLA